MPITTPPAAPVTKAVFFAFRDQYMAEALSASLVAAAARTTEEPRRLLLLFVTAMTLCCCCFLLFEQKDLEDEREEEAWRSKTRPPITQLLDLAFIFVAPRTTLILALLLSFSFLPSRLCALHTSRSTRSSSCRRYAGALDT